MQIYSTDLAVRVSPDGREGKEAMWLPLSVIEVIGELGNGNKITVVIPGWLAKEKGVEND